MDNLQQWTPEEKWVASRDKLVDLARKIVTVDSSDRLQESADLQKAINKKIKELGHARLAFTRPIKELIDQVMKYEKELVNDLAEEHLRLKTMNSQYLTQVAAERMAEARRLAAEEAARAEEAEAAKVDVHSLFGDEVKFAEPVLSDPKPKVAPQLKVAGSRVVEVYQFEVENPDLVPRQFLKVDESVIRQYIQFQKSVNCVPSIEGVRIWKETKVTG